MIFANLITVTTNLPSNTVGDAVDRNAGQKVCDLLADGYKIISAVPLASMGITQVQYVLVKNVDTSAKEEIKK